MGRKHEGSTKRKDCSGWAVKKRGSEASQTSECFARRSEEREKVGACCVKRDCLL